MQTSFFLRKRIPESRKCLTWWFTLASVMERSFAMSPTGMPGSAAYRRRMDAMIAVEMLSMSLPLPNPRLLQNQRRSSSSLATGGLSMDRRMIFRVMGSMLFHFMSDHTI
jgi:hypothetical protein